MKPGGVNLESHPLFSLRFICRAADSTGFSNAPLGSRSSRVSGLVGMDAGFVRNRQGGCFAIGVVYK